MLQLIGPAIAFIMLASSFILGLWFADDGRATILEAPPTVEAEGPIVTDGYISIVFKVYRTRLCGIKVDRAVYDSKGTRFPLPDLDYARVPGRLGSQTVRVPLQIPKLAASGDASYVSVVSRWCNPLQKIFPVVEDPLIVPFIIEDKHHG